MKANEAPKKLYVNFHFIETHPASNQPLVTEQGVNKYDIEYTRTDAFIEKLECWMNENFHQYTGEFAEGILAQFDRTEDAIDSFRKYMKGE